MAAPVITVLSSNSRKVVVKVVADTDTDADWVLSEGADTADAAEQLEEKLLSLSWSSFEPDFTFLLGGYSLSTIDDGTNTGDIEPFFFLVGPTLFNSL